MKTTTHLITTLASTFLFVVLLSACADPNATSTTLGSVTTPSLVNTNQTPSAYNAGGTQAGNPPISTIEPSRLLYGQYTGATTPLTNSDGTNEAEVTVVVEATKVTEAKEGESTESDMDETSPITTTVGADKSFSLSLESNTPYSIKFYKMYDANKIYLGTLKASMSGDAPDTIQLNDSDGDVGSVFCTIMFGTIGPSANLFPQLDHQFHQERMRVCIPEMTDIFESISETFEDEE